MNLNNFLGQPGQSIKSLPAILPLARNSFLFPLISEIELSWSVEVDLTTVESFSGGTTTTTVAGSGSGNVTLTCDSSKLGFSNLGGDEAQATCPENSFRVYRFFDYYEDIGKKYHFVANAFSFGSYSVATTTVTDYDNPGTQTVTETSTDNSDCGGTTLMVWDATVGAAIFYVAKKDENNEFGFMPFWWPTQEIAIGGWPVPGDINETIVVDAEDLGYGSGQVTTTFAATLTPWTY